ncbi:MAG: ATP-binding protein, partial [Planctomycetaceae bacterium]
VLAVDGESRLLYVNPAAIALMEIGPREVTGRMLSEVVRSPGLQALVQRALSSGVDQFAELELPRQQRMAMASCGPLPLSPRAGAVLVLHDVTELRRLEQARREFSSNVSHELKTPLTAIQAYADTLLSGALDDAQVNRGFVQQILEQSERLRRLIFDLLSLSRVESRDMPLELEEIDLNDAVRDCVPAHHSLADSRQVALGMNLPPEPLTAIADREALRTVLDNLVRNALSYTSGGGTVEVNVHRQPDGICIDVVDNGIGIPREHQARIFERFYRVDKARSREVGGTGLGLAIVRHFVELFGAVIELDSEESRGSRFRIRWPTAPDADAGHQ